MAYNIFLSRYSNNDKIIKNSFSRKSSLGMSAYISDQYRYDDEKMLVYNPKKGRDISEVSYTALILPKDIPYSKLSHLVGRTDFVLGKIKNRFSTDKNFEYEDHYVIQDEDVISDFWLENDRNIFDVESDSRLMKNKNKKMRLYNLYLFASPVAHKHFPKELKITHEDLREIDERAVYMVMDEFLLSKGMPIEIGRHQNEENIIHYHVQTPARVLNYVYQKEKIKVNTSEFKAWISKSVMHNMHSKKERQRKKTSELKLRYQNNPTDYSKEKYEKSLNKFNETLLEIEELKQIHIGIKNSGYTYAKYFALYQNKIEKDTIKAKEADGLFAKVKGPTEKYLDTPSALDKMKKRYADVLNQLLIEEGILLPGNELYTYVKSTKDYITTKEGEMWNIPDEKRHHVNREVKKIFQTDLDFEKELIRSNRGSDKKKVKEKSRILVHALKKKIKTSINYYKKDLALDDVMLDDFVQFWIKKVEYVKNNYKEFIVSLRRKDIFNFNWQSKISKNIIQDKRTYEDKKVTTKSIKEGYKEVEIDAIEESVYDHLQEIDEEKLNVFGDERFVSEEYVIYERHFENELLQYNYSRSSITSKASIDIEGDTYKCYLHQFEKIMETAFYDRNENSLEMSIKDHFNITNEKEIIVEEDNYYDFER